MNSADLSPLPVFFLRSLSYDLATLRVVLSVKNSEDLEVKFEPARAFRSFSESDYWHYLSDFRGRPLVQSTDKGCGIFMSESAPYLLDYRNHVRAQEPERAFSCLIATPQEGVEVICCDEPSLATI
jgi:hypothetical protein